ncbi:hypothetical protein K1718_20420 [Roseibium porphyridii]|uniref:Nuclear transport factor 2 family protein n=1 Tax=Roseibium porphyridii TaxID=2866279 RepID=A0ABY8EZC6_9HYPH|nr:MULTISPECIES: nuclear transport factor 2 family protein [Stappiaceae]QFT33220.1 hypothetical protein FIV00_22200 [Labrenzia sp. THAF82]WFE88508.1 hypothetical protein K1718_20420 [Roseibium sp. KMA01]
MTLEETIDTYCAAWSERDPIRRGELLDKAVTANIRYTDPQTDIVGRPGLVDHISGVLAAHVGAKIVRCSAVDEHHGMARFAWRLVKADGTSLPDGLDVVSFDAQTGKLKSVLGFFGPLKS